MAEEYDVIVIGAGPTGENVADRVVQGGLSAALVESDLVGGECSYWACMPSKALLRSGQARDAARRVAGAAQAVTGALDVAATLARRDSFTAHWSDAGQVDWARSHGIDVIRGKGRISGIREVTVAGPDGSTQTLTARRAVAVCTGSSAALPPVPGLADAQPWTTREGTSAEHPPASLVIIGGGVAGCELAQAWSSLGTEVTVVEAADRLLPQLEPFAGDLVGEALRASGIRVLVGTTVEKASSAAPARLQTTGGGLHAERLMVATGRRPNLDGLGLDLLGLPQDHWLQVDDGLRVTAVDGGWLYAAGDVNGRALLTHQGKYQARACGAAILDAAAGRASRTDAWAASCATADHGAVPSVVFTDPQVASVGRTEAQARDDGIPLRAVQVDLGAVAGAALHADGYTGRAKLVVDTDREVIVGATFVGQDVAELLHAATIAVVGEVPLRRLWHAVPAYPTISEAWLRLLEAYGL